MIEKENGIIEYICEGGFGSEAKIKVELRTVFPGIGGTIVTQGGAITALREEFTPSSKLGHTMFLKHMVIKKLDDYFLRKRRYLYSHISRPLGSLSKRNENFEGYLYEWVFGSEAFPWEIIAPKKGKVLIKLHEWSSFIGCFNNAGINLGNDVTDVDNGAISQNVIHQFPEVNFDTYELSSIWKRIDFGPRSITIDYDKLLNYLNENEGDIVDILRSERYEMITYAVEYLKKRENMDRYYIAILEDYVGDYRNKSLSHYLSRGSGDYESRTHWGKRKKCLI
jgi:hypothetical protein